MQQFLICFLNIVEIKTSKTLTLTRWVQSPSMACNGSGCQSGSCYKDEDATCNEPIKSEETDSTNPTNVCIKCKLNDAVSGYGGIDDGRFCADCFKTNLFGKFRFAVTSNAMITPTDKVLVAFSGGPSSRSAQIQSPFYFFSPLNLFNLWFKMLG